VVDHVYGLRQLAAFQCLEFRTSDLYWTAKLRIRRTCGVEQSPTSLSRKYVTGYMRLSQNWKNSVVHSDSWWPPGAVAAFFTWFWRRDI